MGSLACFPGALALPHHLVVQQCASDVGKTLPFLDYVVLGDDIVIWDKEVAGLYKIRMTVSLGVSISAPKSIIARGAAEFAKTIVREGSIYSPLP